MNQAIADATEDHTATQPRWTEVRRAGLLWRLDLERYLDREIEQHGCFETRTTDIVRQYVRPGMKILDVGANFGYFTTLFADLVGPNGHVWAFEPTQKYGQRIQWHLDANRMGDRVTVLDFGLSDCEQQKTIDLEEDTASLHLWHGSAVLGQESIRLRRLDDLAEQMHLPRVDFIKIDIDGHEPFFLKGAQAYLRQHHPAMLLEFAWRHLEMAGTDIWGLKTQLNDLGYELYSQQTLKRIEGDGQFLAEVGDRAHSSANVWAFATGQGPAFLPNMANHRVRHAIAELTAKLGRPTQVWLFGAGQHTARAMVGNSSWNTIGRITAIIDDDPRLAGSEVLGLPVFDRRQALDKLVDGAKIDALILSTDTHQRRFSELAAPFHERSIRVVTLYPS
jgi:FkbM family methyltransferase